ncbi:MAG: hypothetical protein IJO54_07385 [Oscillospiraceae bacterium]|nr:hypothetical protein [Oscillospiraceae bacterium]
MIIKRIAAVVLTIAMAAVSLTGCSKTYEKVVTIDGVDVAPNMYLYAQYMAYLDAESRITDSSTDVLSATIEETPAKEWIHAKTIENLKKFVWVEKTAQEQNAELAAEDMEYIDYQSEYYWPMAESIMKANGIGEETYKKFITNEYLSEYVVFQNIYGKDGEKEPSDDAVVEYMDGKYARIKGFELSKVVDGTEDFVDAQGLADITAIAAEAVYKLNNGAELDTVVADSLNAAAEINGDKTEYTAEGAAKYTIERYLTKENVTSYEEVLTANAFTIDVDGEWVFDDVEKEIVVYQRIKNLKDQTEIDYYKLSLTHEMCADDYKAHIEEATAAYEVVEDAAAVGYYSVEKIK